MTNSEYKISEYIELLERFKEEHGDLKIETTFYDGRREPARTPTLAYRKILNKRESRPEFAWKESHRGEPVCKI